MSWLWWAGYLFTSEYAPVSKWYQVFTYWITWPSHLGKFVKDKFDE